MNHRSKSLFIRRVGSVFFMATIISACSQPERVESAVATDNMQSSPSDSAKQDSSLRLAQKQPDACRRNRNEDSTTLDLGDKTPDSSDIVGFFKGQDCPKMLTRQIKKKTDLTSSPKKLSMQINFEFNSSRLTPSGKQALQPVALALASEELRNRRFVIEGHTDAKGKSAYNLALSKRRALTVKRYLVNQFALDPARFQTVGKGSTELFNSAEPNASENRRVVIALPQ